MRIGIDGSCLAHRRGFGRFARWAVTALAEGGVPDWDQSAFAGDVPDIQYVLILDGPSARSGNVNIPAGWEVITADDVRTTPTAAAGAHSRRSFRDMAAMSRAVRKANLDVLFFPATYSYFPVWTFPAKRPKILITMHDTLALERPDLVFPHRTGRMLWRIKEGFARRQADAIVTVSRTSQRDLARWLGCDPGIIRVVPEGPEPIFSPRPRGSAAMPIIQRYGIDPKRPYILYVGGLSPHKNLVRLVKAFAQAAPTHYQLVLVGDHQDSFHTHLPAIRDEIAACGAVDRVLLPGYVPDEDLATLYSCALCLAHPSLWEGFGLPPIEAMACGTPVIHSRAGSLPEVIGDAGLAFDAENVGQMAAAMQILITHPELRADLSRRALARALSYRRPAATAALHECFASVLRPRKGATSFTHPQPHPHQPTPSQTRRTESAVR